MKKTFLLILGLALVASVTAQTPQPGPQQGPQQGPDLARLGLSETEMKAVETDLKAWEQANREWEADLQLIDAQRNRLMVRDALDKGALEKTFRDQYDLQLKRDLARIDLVIKWRAAYGIEKVRDLEGTLRGPQGPNQQGQPGQMAPMGGPKKP